MEKLSKIYMFAIMPPPVLSAEIHDLRKAFSEKYGFLKALKPPVHITLYPPFKIPLHLVPDFEEAASGMQHPIKREKPFGITLNNFGFFNNKRYPVVFIHVMKDQALTDFYTHFKIAQKEQLSFLPLVQNFTPHITIGYRDIDPLVFPEIMAEYSAESYKASFSCDAVYLWKHSGRNWEVLEAFPLSGTKNQLPLL